MAKQDEDIMVKAVGVYKGTIAVVDEYTVDFKETYKKDVMRMMHDYSYYLRIGGWEGFSDYYVNLTIDKAIEEATAIGYEIVAVDDCESNTLWVQLDKLHKNDDPLIAEIKFKIASNATTSNDNENTIKMTNNDVDHIAEEIKNLINEAVENKLYQALAFAQGFFECKDNRFLSLFKQYVNNLIDER